MCVDDTMDIAVDDESFTAIFLLDEQEMVQRTVIWMVSESG